MSSAPDGAGMFPEYGTVLLCIMASAEKTLNAGKAGVAGGRYSHALHLFVNNRYEVHYESYHKNTGGTVLCAVPCGLRF